jgi:hypothetical protein
MEDYYKKYLKYKAKYLELKAQIGGKEKECVETKWPKTSPNKGIKSCSTLSEKLIYGDCEIKNGSCKFHQKCGKSNNEYDCTNNKGIKNCEWKNNSCINVSKKKIKSTSL